MRRPDFMANFFPPLVFQNISNVIDLSRLSTSMVLNREIEIGLNLRYLSRSQCTIGISVSFVTLLKRKCKPTRALKLIPFPLNCQLYAAAAVKKRPGFGLRSPKRGTTEMT